MGRRRRGGRRHLPASYGRGSWGVSWHWGWRGRWQVNLPAGVGCGGRRMGRRRCGSGCGNGCGGRRSSGRSGGCCNRCCSRRGGGECRARSGEARRALRCEIVVEGVERYSEDIFEMFFNLRCLAVELNQLGLACLLYQVANGQMAKSIDDDSSDGAAVAASVPLGGIGN